MKEQSNEDKDINEVFDDIVFSEDKIVQTAIKEGESKGLEEGKVEGYHIGYHRGVEIGAEIGFYTSVIGSIKSSKHESTAKIKSTIEKLEILLHNFPTDNNQETDIIHHRDEIRALFRKVSSLLRIPISYPPTSSLSF